MKGSGRLLLIGICVVWIGVVAFFGLNALSTFQKLGELETSRRYLGCFESGSPTQAEMERNAWIRLPPSARALVPYSEDFCNTFYLRFEMSAADLKPFTANTLIKQFAPNKQPLDFGQLPEDLGWELKAVKSYLGGVYEVPGAHRQSVLIDTGDPKVYVVYVIMADLTT